MKLVLKHGRKQHLVTNDVTEFNLGKSFIDSQILMKLIIQVYKDATGEDFPTKDLYSGTTVLEMTGKKSPSCLKPPR